ncbi:MAG: hypothetical protein ABL893_09735 [Hyphomicrobium sp.]|nr:hypothetical protein [Hyphomicrobium sp.]
MSKLRGKSKKLNLIVSEIAKIKVTLKKLAKANKALAVAVAKGSVHPKQKKNP